MTQEEKAKRYDEAIERAKAYQGLRSEMEIIFPELAESEDERIRKALLEHFITFNQEDNYLDDIPFSHVVAWLEKQGESYTKRDVDDAYLKGVTNTKNEIEKQYEANYQIRKDIATFIFNYRGDIKDRAKWIDYLGIKVSFIEMQGEQKPVFEMKTPEESLGVDSDTYNKIVDECIYGDDKPAWSEEDELHIRELESLIKQVWAKAEHENDKDSIHKMSDLSFFLKTLKPQLKQEWSKEDESMLYGVIETEQYMLDVVTGVKTFDVGNEQIESQCTKELAWLKILKDKCTWKPSDEQMKVLNEVLNFAANHESPHWNDYIFGTLNNLIRQLKKLREE